MNANVQPFREQLMNQEQKYCAIMIQKNDFDLEQVKRTWSITLPDKFKRNGQFSTSIQYLILWEGFDIKLIALIDEWMVNPSGAKPQTAKLLKYSEQTELLRQNLQNFEESSFASYHYLGYLEKAINDHSTLERPASLPLALNLKDAAAAVAYRYGVEPKQVQLSIHYSADQ